MVDCLQGLDEPMDASQGLLDWTAALDAVLLGGHAAVDRCLAATSSCGVQAAARYRFTVAVEMSNSSAASAMLLPPAFLQARTFSG